MADPAIHLTSKAAEKIREQVAKRPQAGPQSGIRVGVKGGGCSGLSYVIEFCDQPRAKPNTANLSITPFAAGGGCTFPQAGQRASVGAREAPQLQQVGLDSGMTRWKKTRRSRIRCAAAGSGT